MSAPFAYLIPGRPVDSVVVADDTGMHFGAQIPQAESLNHLCCFLTGATPFPDGMAATVHFEFPGQGWKLIGTLSNAKPSAIFRLRGLAVPSAAGSASAFAGGQGQGAAFPAASGLVARLGIAVEPAEAVEAQAAALREGADGTAGGAATATSTDLVLRGQGGNNLAQDPTQLAFAVARNIYNHLAGFAQTLPDGRAYVEMGAIEKWFESFQRKLRNAGGVSFLQTD